MYILIKTNDFFNPDNIDGRIQTEKFDDYKQAYAAMEKEVIASLSCHDKKFSEYLPIVLEHIEFTNVYLGEYEAREHSAGGSNRYWKIIEV